MRVGLVDVGGKITNLALQKLSSFHKAQGHEVVLNPLSPIGLDKTYVSMIFTKDREKAVSIYGSYPGVEFGGTGFSLEKKLPDEIENMHPDYSLYTAADIFSRISGRIAKKENTWIKAEEIVNAGIGFLSRGCVNTAKTCPWCAVPAKEGVLRRVGSLNDIINPRSNKIVLLDNSICANPDIMDILLEIKQRKLVVDLTQGLDVRRLTPEIAKALSEIKHWRSIHYSWDMPLAGASVLRGIEILSEFVRKSAQMCYVLCGFNTDFLEDQERVRVLKELGIKPYIMRYLDPNNPTKSEETYETIRLRHFQRYINAPRAIYKTNTFDEYEGWINAQKKMSGAIGATQLELAW